PAVSNVAPEPAVRKAPSMNTASRGRSAAARAGESMREGGFMGGRSEGGVISVCIAAPVNFSYHRALLLTGVTMNARPADFAPLALTSEQLQAHWMPFTANRHFKA